MARIAGTTPRPSWVDEDTQELRTVEPSPVARSRYEYANLYDFESRYGLGATDDMPQQRAA
jgi:hypothetical protein